MYRDDVPNDLKIIVVEPNPDRARDIIDALKDDGWNNVKMIGVEAEGLGLKSGKHAATLGQGSIGVLHGSKSYVLQDSDGQIQEAHSISAGPCIRRLD